MTSEAVIRPVVPPQPNAEANRNGPLLMLLKLEADAREVATADELRYLISTESRKLVQARQCFVFGIKGDAALVLEAISGLPFVDRNAPMTMAMEDIVVGRPRAELHDKLEFNIKAYKGEFEEFASDYPFPFCLWMPFLDRASQLQGGMLLVREKPWTDSQIVVARRLAKTFAHALRELGSIRRRRTGRPSLRLALACGVCTVALAIRVPVTAMAPFEIVPKQPELIAAPIDGTIETVFVTPGAPVAKGQALVKFSAEALQSKLDIAQREVLVAEANLKLAAQLAFTDERGRRDLATAAAQVELKSAERDLAAYLVKMSEVRAERDGIALFSSPDDLIGRPVVTGEKLMRIADPDHVEVSMDVALSDAGLLETGTRVKLFFDDDPLNAREAVLTSSDYKPKPDAANQMQYKAVATLSEGARVPRLGVRGTALLVGPSASLAFVLLRRPLAALRQRVAL